MPYKNREDQRAYLKQHYEDNKEAYKRRARKHTNGARKENAQHVLEFLKDHPCCDCGETDPVVLTFDHKRPSKKYKTVCALIRSGASAKKIDEEIQKCVVRCFNCHMRRTAKQQGWYRLLKESK